MKAPTMAALVMWFSPLACTYDEPEAEVAKVQQAEIIEVHGCPPGTLGNGEICNDPLEGGGDGGGGPGSVGGEGGPGGSGPGGGSVPVIRMDPEPDPKKDFKSCWDWCAWSFRQCQKECLSKHPYPDWDGYNQCMENRCQNHRDPKIGRRACEADCTERWRDRP